jgi:hypothetical protein
MFLLFSLISICSLPFITAIVITPPSGQYHVGISKHVLQHTTINVPNAPHNETSTILLTLYYPTLRTPQPTGPYLDPPLAKLFEEAWFYKTGLISNLTSTLQIEAPTLPLAARTSQFPTIIFGPGGTGPPSQCYTTFLSELASRGYTVAALDHPYEQPFLQYPYINKGIYGFPVNFSPSRENFSMIYKYRLTDTEAFLKAYPDLVAKHRFPFNTTHYGLLGHSIGGAAAMGSMLELKDYSILGAFNLDGFLWGAANSSNRTVADEKKPVFQMGAQDHFPDPSWQTFPSAQSGWWREVLVQGTKHLNFSDIVLWNKLNGTRGEGRIDGDRLVALMRAYIVGFFDTLRGEKVPLVEGPSSLWPEVDFLGGKD